MRPIVNGLEEQYRDQIDFLSLNSLDGGQGEAAFGAYGLRGHPSTVVVAPDGEVSSIHFGVVSQRELDQSLQNALGP
jgi:hypothetical protein